MSRYLLHKIKDHFHLFVFAHIHTSINILLTVFAFAMQQFQTYPLSTSSISRTNNVVDDKKYFSDNLSRFTSNDSGISYGDSDDNESLFSNEYDFDSFDPNYRSTITITDDGIQ